MKTTCTLLASLAMIAVGSAGERTVTIDKGYQAPEPMDCFKDQELQIDLFGQYTDGNSPNHAGPIRNHGWGGGVGINYFFTRNLGIGVDAAWLYATEHPALGGGKTTIHNLSGSLIARFPIECVAPYLYVGGGAALDGEQWASAHAGAGVEWRVEPQKFGVFIDGRWTYYGDRFGHGDLNNFSGRVGVRWVF